jgi:putative ATP-binding cassette transporter
LFLQFNCRFAILDEATSALDELNQINLYQLAQKKLTFYLSIGHRPELMQFHEAILQINPGTAGWTLKKFNNSTNDE